MTDETGSPEETASRADTASSEGTGPVDAAGLAALFASVAPLVERFQAADAALYLVGGVVRDHLRGLPIAGLDDIDMTTDARPGLIKKLVGPLAEAMWTQGERFGTIGVRIAGVDYEITTHRADEYEPGTRKPSVAFATDLETDLSRRDFTVNAMARSIVDGALIDPFGGREDLAAGRLDTPVDPHLSFSDDPLRMLRAARFAAGANLTAVPRVEQAMVEMRDRIEIVSAERIRVELLKLLGGADPTPGLQLLRRTGLHSHVLPELEDADLGRLAALGGDAETRLSYLWLGLGTDAVAKRSRRLRMSNEQTSAAKIVEAAVAMARANPVDAERARRFAFAAGKHQSRALAVLAAVDSSLHRSLVEGLDQLGEDLDDWAVPLDGEQLMALLGVEPGRILGEATKVLQEARFVNGPLSPAAAEKTILDWWQSQTN